ncbi:universal stress protein [Paraburkholderia sp. WS6]|uniref:Universal stress protein n=1 Tax=Paraburkholderia madseniana TaxID=2599607 RepID=A0AAP5BAI2_9BURK|nr:universal stress protein [Paraburkholderia sp. WS6]MCX4145089.1 universal stress protein [Paraburkholderia madseniana]MDN7148040.1 universal stress protein [Paraburkholderia sp. WS6]MDQ6406920.1 universal stress protein [Paraburkholderia madseniana]
MPSCLQRCVRRQGGNLVVMGTQGRHGVGTAVLGSVTDRFPRLSTCPVRLIRSEAGLSQ